MCVPFPVGSPSSTELPRDKTHFVNRHQNLQKNIDLQRATYSFNKYFLSAYFVPGTVLSSGTQQSQTRSMHLFSCKKKNNE